MTFDYCPLPHPGIQALNPYVPGKPSEEVAREHGLTNIIKLASNENPWGCSSKAYEALQSFQNECYATYPSPSNHPLHQHLCNRLDITEDMLILSNGSDALFELLLIAFGLHHNKSVLVHEYSFIAFSICAQVLGIPTLSVPLKKDWHVDTEAMILACHQKQPAIIYLANPNNPVGAMLTHDELEQFLAAIPPSTLVLLDEAYYPYDTYSPPNTHKNHAFSLKGNLDLLSKHKNLIITRTFSKVYGLAALRLGYAVAAPEIIAPLLKIQLPFSVNQAALIAGNAALSDDDFIIQSIQANTEGKSQLQKGFEKLGVAYLPSFGNFMTIDCKKNAQGIYEKLLREGVIVRPLISYGLPNYLRVTIGKPQQNIRFLDKLKLCL
ncbi:MAG: histidinol-phosphate transaminase [Legionella sp.]|nr:histidinol-phosphate transaminase [Legionella sp.]